MTILFYRNPEFKSYNFNFSLTKKTTNQPTPKSEA